MFELGVEIDPVSSIAPTTGTSHDLEAFVACVAALSEIGMELSFLVP